MSNTQVSISTQDTPQYPLSYSAIQLQDGFYEPKGRKDVVLFVTQANPTTGLRTVLRFSNDGKNLAYPANGWNGYSFRRINASINLSA